MSIKELINAYSKGIRRFSNLEFPENGSVMDLNLSGVIFENCFLFLNFRKTNLKNSKFIECNLKTANFSDSNLTNVIIKKCLIESTIFEGAKTKGLKFEENYYFGLVINQNDLNYFLKNN